MTTKTRKITAVVAMAVLLSATSLCSYGDDTTSGTGPSARVGKAQVNHAAWQTTALKQGGGITPATEKPETYVIRHQVLIATFEELFAQLTDLMDMLKLAIQASRLTS
ncbi:MAG TPA: hypothetical protein PKY77_05520 [Phycisphaerae bacterium]|nr:hypothetical protein [Phycisphaerae bacterium]HRY68973.1 hypothetical protein [Phycisphaerae bacterium]HSA25800.1 hypothetical protein [Phycisphaerae bacterium]